MIHFNSCTITECGKIYRNNEDWVKAVDEAGIFAIADGIGGRPGGNLASQMAVEVFISQLSIMNAAERLDESNIYKVIEIMNFKVRELAEADSMLTGLGTTFSSLILNGITGKTVHIGDSRIYQFHENQLVQLTTDHTVAVELMKINQFNPEGAKHSRFSNILSRYIGGDEVSKPDIENVYAYANDLFILSTDGLDEIIETQELQNIIISKQKGTPEAICEIIKQKALDNCPRDNATVAVIKVLEI